MDKNEHGVLQKHWQHTFNDANFSKREPQAVCYLMMLKCTSLHVCMAQRACDLDFSLTFLCLRHQPSINTLGMESVCARKYLQKQLSSQHCFGQ
jgi:hypothetical protein